MDTCCCFGHVIELEPVMEGFSGGQPIFFPLFNFFYTHGAVEDIGKETQVYTLYKSATAQIPNKNNLTIKKKKKKVFAQITAINFTISSN